MTPGPVDPDRLLEFAASAYAAVGLSAEDARLCADSLVQADLWGHQSHGVLRLPWYVKRLQNRVCDPAARPEVLVDCGALALVDGHDGMGQVMAAFAADEAVARSRKHGIGAVALRRSNHFGTAMYFTLRAAGAGCVAFLSTNASPAMAPWGGRKKVVGTNPWSWAAPAGEAAPMVVDIANTGVARGKIYLAKQRGEQIPLSWALDADGVPTADPVAAIEGLVQPMAGHKGYAIALMMDVLSGVLTGSSFGSGVAGPYEFDRRSGAGQVMIAIDIARLMAPAEFDRRIQALIAEVRRVPLARGHDEILYPGELEARCDRRNREHGLSLPEDTLRDLSALAGELGLADRLPFAAV